MNSFTPVTTLLGANSIQTYFKVVCSIHSANHGDTCMYMRHVYIYIYMYTFTYMVSNLYPL